MTELRIEMIKDRSRCFPMILQFFFRSLIYGKETNTILNDRISVIKIIIISSICFLGQSNKEH